jgi:hypothetical protein
MCREETRSWKSRQPVGPAEVARAVRRSRLGALVALAAAVVLAAPMVALGDAANPSGATTGVETFHADGTVTVSLKGSWTWAGQSCTGRYGVGWSVDWWGVGPSQVKTPFALLDATTVVGTGSPNKWSTTAVVPGGSSLAGALAIKTPAGLQKAYFHVGPSLSGQNLSLCANAVGKNLSGSWSAAATYPTADLVPKQLCVNLYDLHGKPGRSNGNQSAFTPLANDDNSIDTNDFDPSVGGNCMLTSSLTVGSSSE